MTGMLFETLVADVDGFTKLFDVVFPLLTKMNDATRLHCYYRQELEQLITHCPKNFAKLIVKVLPDNIDNWPWEIGEVIDAICRADDSILADQDFRRLKRKWDSR